MVLEKSRRIWSRRRVIVPARPPVGVSPRLRMKRERLAPSSIPAAHCRGNGKGEVVPVLQDAIAVFLSSSYP
jgi:hypothetical protein